MRRKLLTGILLIACLAVVGLVPVSAEDSGSEVLPLDATQSVRLPLRQVSETQTVGSPTGLNLWGEGAENLREYRTIVYATQVEADRVAAEAARKAQERREAQQRAKAQQRAAQAPSAPVASGSVWDRLAQCESNGNWQINTGNGYYGGLQFNLQTWQAYGGTGYPHEHSRATQIAVAERLHAARGFQPWPACSKKLGLR